MTTIIFVRHALNDWVSTGRLAGWTPDIHLNAEGQRQAENLGRRMATSKLAAIYSSPLERAIETASAIARHHPALSVQVEKRIGEVDFGDWTGKRLCKLRRKPLWQVVQNQPSIAHFPGGEGIREMQSRVIASLETYARQFPDGSIVIISHADVIKVAVAHFAGIPLDLYQRIVIAPASISTIQIGKSGVHLLGINDTAHYTLEGMNHSK
nr:MSMEG_4193 family putative phosphomutase [Anaerolineae bacterium]